MILQAPSFTFSQKISFRSGSPKSETLNIMGSQSWWFGDPRTLLYRVKPLHRRVQWFLGNIISGLGPDLARKIKPPKPGFHQYLDATDWIWASGTLGPLHLWQLEIHSSKNPGSNKNRNSTQNATKKHMLKCQLFVNVDWNFQTHLGFLPTTFQSSRGFPNWPPVEPIFRLREHHSLKWKSVVSIKGRTKTSETCLRWFLESLLAGNVRHWNEVSHVTSR